MENVAIFIGNTQIRWSTLIVICAVFVWLSVSYSLHVSHGGKRYVMFVCLPYMVFFSVLFGRAIHWYSHSELYKSAEDAVYSRLILMSDSTLNYIFISVRKHEVYACRRPRNIYIIV